jgi:hypothetical protein
MRSLRISGSKKWAVNLDDAGFPSSLVLSKRCDTARDQLHGLAEMADRKE